MKDIPGQLKSHIIQEAGRKATHGTSKWEQQYGSQRYSAMKPGLLKFTIQCTFSSLICSLIKNSNNSKKSLTFVYIVMV